MARAIWTPVAEPDLDDILFYIAFIDRRFATGERPYYEIRDLIAQLAEQQTSGHTHPDTPAGWRYVKHKRWLIFFQPHPDGVEVMRVVDGARDLPRHLGRL
jgi:toxin ParE1/3/4